MFHPGVKYAVNHCFVDARPRCIMYRNVINVVSDLGQRVLHRVRTFATAGGNVDTVNGDIGSEFCSEFFLIFFSQHNNDLFDVAAFKK